MSEANTDRKSTILFISFFLAIMISVFVLFERYIVQKDFEIFQNEDGSLPQPEE